VAISTIQENDEITHSYTDCTNPRMVRQESLKNIYSFHCTCSLCQQDRTPNKTGQPEFNQRISQYLANDDPDISKPLQLKNTLREIRSASSTAIFSVDSFQTQTLHKTVSQKKNCFV
jgi:hypothetical protein